MVIALQHQVAQLQRMLFGRRSETLPADHPSQGFLFGRIEPQSVCEKGFFGRYMLINGQGGPKQWQGLPIPVI